MYIGSQLTPKLHLIFMQVALGVERVASLNVFSMEILLFIATGLYVYEISKARDIFHINVYPNEMLDNDAKNFYW